jgi:hypothetical protein
MRTIDCGQFFVASIRELPNLFDSSPTQEGIVSVVSTVPGHRLTVEFDKVDPGVLQLEIYGDQWATAPSPPIASN